MSKKFIFLVFALGLFACNQPKQPEVNTNVLYFDITGYFKQEATRLRNLNPEIVKEVSVNGLMEQKKMKISDWEKELAIFTNADINKASWKGSFKITKTPGTETYTSSNKRIPVKKVVIQKQDSKVKRLEIIITNKNILYSSGDTLFYYPDSLYKIIKHQKIKLLKPKTYTVTGTLK